MWWLCEMFLSLEWSGLILWCFSSCVPVCVQDSVTVQMPVRRYWKKRSTRWLRHGKCHYPRADLLPLLFLLSTTCTVSLTGDDIENWSSRTSIPIFFWKSFWSDFVIEKRNFLALVQNCKISCLKSFFDENFQSFFLVFFPFRPTEGKLLTLF